MDTPLPDTTASAYTVDALTRRVRLCLSYREQAGRIVAEAAERHASGQLSGEELARRRMECKRHAEAAERRLSEFRVQIGRLLARVEQELAELRATLHNGERQSTAAQVRKPYSARSEQQQLRLGTLRERLWQLGAAHDAADVGGFIELPLGDYPRAIESIPQPLRVRDRAYVYVPAALMAMTVFLPWIEVEAGRASLAEMNGILPAVGTTSLLVSMLANLWLVLAALACAAVVLAEIPVRRASGLGLAACGLAGAVTIVAPGPVLAAAGVPLGSLFGWLEGGALLSLGGAAGVVASGLWRLRQPSTKRGAALLVGSRVLAAVACALAFLGMVLLWAPPDTLLRAEFPPGFEPNGNLTITCRNVDAQPIELYVPWPEGSPAGGSAVYPRRSYGVELHVRETEDTEWRLSAQSDAAWSVAGLSGPGPVTLLPGTTHNIELSAQEIAAAGIEPVEVSIRVTNRNGNVLARTDFPFPNPADLPLPRTPAPVWSEPGGASPPRTLPPHAPQPGEPDTLPDEPPEISEPSGPPTFTVTYVGSVGPRAILRVAQDDTGESDRITLGEGDSLAGWTLLEVVSSPPGVELWHPRHGTARVIRGASATLEGRFHNSTP